MVPYFLTTIMTYYHPVILIWQQTTAIYTYSRHGATLAFIWSWVSGHLTNVNPILTLLLALFYLPPTPEETVLVFR